MFENNNQQFLKFVKKILRKLRPRFSFHYVAYTALSFLVVFSLVSLASATTPNPGHPWIEVGDGVFAVTNNQTAVRTYTFPDANATILTTNALVTVGQGGTGAGTFTANGVLYGNTTSAVGVTAAGTTGQCLIATTSSAPSWGACGGSTRLDQITAATSTPTAIDSTSFGQEWKWSTLAGTTAFKLSSASTAAASNTQKLFELALTGVNATSTQTTYASYISNAHTGTSATNYAGYFTATGVSNTSNIGLYATASGATTNYAAWIDGTLHLKNTDIQEMGTRSISIGAAAPSVTDSFFVGQNAGLSATSASNANFIGSGAGNGATSANLSNFIGYQAGLSASSANNSNFFGQQAGYQATSASYAEFIGAAAGYQATNATNSQFLGVNSGFQATNASNSIFIGQNAGLSDTVNNTGNVNDFSILIGKNTSTGGNKNSIAIGDLAANTAQNQLVVGSSTREISSVFIGSGVTNASPVGTIFNATGGSGTNIAGASLTFAGGKATGNAVGGSLIFQTSDAGSSGATLQSLTTKATLLANGNFGIGNTTPGELLTLGIAGSKLGVLSLAGNTSGKIIIQPQAAAGTYNFNLPTTAGTSGDILTSGGGSSSPMTWTTLAGIATSGLTNGSGTTASGTAVNLGGLLTVDANIQIDSGLSFNLKSAGNKINFIVNDAYNVAMGDVEGSGNGNSFKIDDTNNLAYYNKDLTNDGFFGINTTTPTVALDVVGEAHISNSLTLAVLAGGGTKCLQTDNLGVISAAAAACGGGSGTVTNTGGSLTSNAVVLGAGTNDTKVSTGITTDGTAKLILGVNTTTLGTLKMFGNTSGDVTIQPTAIAGTATVQTLPATTGTLVNRVTTGNGVSASNSDGALSFTLGAITPTTVNGNTFTTGSSTYTGTAAAVYTFPTATKTIAANDGSNWTIASQAIGDLLVASSTTAYGRLADVALGSCLISGGVGAAPSWGSCGGGASTWDTITSPAGNQTLSFGTNTSSWTSTASTQTFLNITANSLTTGQVLNIGHTTGVIATGGSLARISSSSNDTNTTQGVLLDLASTASTAGTQFLQTYSGLTTGIGQQIVSNSLSSGTLLDIQSNGTAGLTNQKGLNILLAGTNSNSTQTTYGAYVSNTHAGTGAVDYAGYFSSTGGGATNIGLYATASGATTNLALNVDAGQTLLGGTTLTSGTKSKLNIVSTLSTGAAVGTDIAGIHGDYTFTNGGSSGFVQAGNRFLFTNTPTTNSNTMVGESLRVVDSSGLANLVRGIDINAAAGTNTAGTNTGLRASARTFGVQAITDGSAGGVAVPAGLYAENTGTTGDVARFYTGTMTSATSMIDIYHETSTFTGDAILIDMAVGAGDDTKFTGNFLDFKERSVQRFKVTDQGVTSMGLSSTASTNAVCSSLANTTAPTAGTAYEIRDCNAAPAADYAEMYPVESGIGFGDIVATGSEMVNTYDDTDGNIDWTKIKGKVTRLVKSNKNYQSNVIGIVADNYGDFTSAGHNIKDTDNPMPVALNGRVPVKVSNASQPIAPGDYITTSDELGKATKATKAGQVIGKALEAWAPNTGQATVMVYVEQGFYNGQSLSQFAGISAIDNGAFARQVLHKFLESVQSSNSSSSELLLDRLAAGIVITPKVVADNVEVNKISAGDSKDVGLILGDNGKFTIGGQTTTPAITFDSLGNATFAGTLTAKKIQVADLAGIQAITDQINNLTQGQEAFTLTASVMNTLSGALTVVQADVAQLKADVDGTNTTVAGLVASGTDINTRLQAVETLLAANAFNALNALNALNTNTLAVTGGASFSGETTFNGNTNFSNITSFTGGATFSSQVEFTVPPLYNKDTAGYALVKQGDRRVHVVFNQAYIATPVVNTSVTFESSDNIDDNQAATLFTNDVRFIIVSKDQTGFTILLNKPAPRDIRFSWNALQVRDPQIFESVIEGIIIDQNPTPTPTPTPSPEPDPIPTPPQDPTPSPEPDPIPTPPQDPTPPQAPDPTNTLNQTL